MSNPTDFLDDWIGSSTFAGSEGLYFIGTFDRRITFYSQQVRAFRLVRALHQKGKLKQTDTVAVVGAGAAGITCAVGLAALGYQVALFDPADEVLQLQSASPRLLHPHIYEWPALGSLERNAGLPFFDWSFGDGRSVVTRLLSEFHSLKSRLTNLLLHKRYRLTSLTTNGSDWRLLFDNSETRIVQHVVLAIGFGDERKSGAASSYDYWKERGVGTAAFEPNAPATYFISGNGDGALTDILSLMIKDFEHVSFTEAFLSYFGPDILPKAVKKAYESIDADGNLEPSLRKELLAAFTERGVFDRLVPKLRTDRLVTINANGHLLSGGKAAQLNQCMVFAVLEAAKQAGIEVRRTSGKVEDVLQRDSGLEPVGIVLNGVPLLENFQYVILRHGPDKKARFQPAETQFTAFEKATVESFKGKPELLAPPTLDPETYTFFSELFREHLCDAATRLQLEGQVQREASAIILTWDAATQKVVQKGAVNLEDLVEECETAASSISVQLEVKPELVDAVNLMRLAAASGGKIVLSVGTVVATAWKSLLPNAIVVATSWSRYECRDIGETNFSDQVDASLLRQLEKVLASTKAAGICDTLGRVAPDVLDAALVTWIGWRATLDASPVLRSDFLAWLGSISPTIAKPWSGDGSLLDRMASALILMLATHLGEPLQPASVLRGNLRFSDDGRALGSAAMKVDDGSLLTDWDRPDHWDVDALILSGSSEVSVASTDDTVLNAGDAGIGLSVARRVKPAIIRNDVDWRTALKSGLPAWKDAVQLEFRLWRERQDTERERVLI